MKRLRVALVEASAASTHVYSRVYLPRVGIPTLAALVKELGHECEVWFQAMSPVDAERLSQFDIVGIGSLTNTITEAYRLADACKRPGNTVVMGGPHVTFSAAEALEHCDYVVLGEGDVAFPAMVSALANGGSARSIPGLAFRLPSGEVERSSPAAAVDYASLPSPDYSLAPQAKDTPPIVVTSRGCPHGCHFCAVKAMFGGKYRFKSSEQVIAELRKVLHRSVCFGDDNFCAHPARTKQLLRDMIAQDAVPRRWAAQMCVGGASDEELLDLMQASRCRIVYVGIESVNAATLRKLGKPHAVKAIETCVQRLHAHNIGIHGMFVVDPDDDVDAVREIVDYAIATDIDTIQICPLTPFPGTRSYDEWQDRLLHRQWSVFDGLHVVVQFTQCSPYDMQTAIHREMSRFYSLRRALSAWRPGRAWRMKYRLGGWYLLRKGYKENAAYIEGLRQGTFPGE